MSTAVGDEGGFAPNVENHEAAMKLILEAIENAGLQSRRANALLGLDCAASEFYKDGMYALAGEGIDTERASIGPTMLAKLVRQIPRSSPSKTACTKATGTAGSC